MSEKDLGLKVATRRLYWNMGMATRLNVKLSTHVSRGSSRSATEEYTDLDVLGLGQAADGRLNTVIGDCKTSRRAANERCFWLRGVADFFGASSAHLVRSQDVPVSTRQLAERLNLGVLTVPDLERMLEWYERPVPEDVEILFDESAVQRQQKMLTGLEGGLSRLIDYRNLGYWIVEPHRTIDGVIFHLAQGSERLDASNPAHRVLFADLTWLFCLSLIRLTGQVRNGHASDVELAVKQYIFGGPAGLRDKQNQADLVRRLTPRKSKTALDVLPQYYPGLLEVVSRHLRRPALATTLLRYAEWLSASPAMPNLRRTSLAAAFEGDFDPIAAKLLGDTMRFLVSAARLPDDFLTMTELTAPSPAPAPSDGVAETASPREPVSLQGQLLPLDEPIARSEEDAGDRRLDVATESDAMPNAPDSSS